MREGDGKRKETRVMNGRGGLVPENKLEVVRKEERKGRTDDMISVHPKWHKRLNTSFRPKFSSLHVMLLWSQSWLSFLM
jgi:hypothetical protein